MKAHNMPSKIAKYVKNNRKSILDAIRGNNKGDTFADHIERIHDLANNPAEAIRYIANITDQGKTPRTPVTLEILTQYVQNISELEGYLDQLKTEIEQASKRSDFAQLTLSTIHSAKGMEFHNVIILDVNDRFIPHNTPNDREGNEGKMDLYQEERRLFYVAMTRAKDNLFIAHTDNNNSVFVNELFGKQHRTNCSESPYSGQIKSYSNPYKPRVVQHRNISRTIIPPDIVFQGSDYRTV